LEFAYRGLKIPYGSTDESLAMLAHDREQQIRFYSVLSVVSAIISTGNKIIQTLANQPGDDKAGKQMGEVMSALRQLLLPEDSFEAEKKINRIKETLEREVAKGPISIRPQSGKKRKRALAKKSQE
jgi:hypothetical protein